jgi:hypothetical protein
MNQKRKEHKIKFRSSSNNYGEKDVGNEEKESNYQRRIV